MIYLAGETYRCCPICSKPRAEMSTVLAGLQVAPVGPEWLLTDEEKAARAAIPKDGVATLPPNTLLQLVGRDTTIIACFECLPSLVVLGVTGEL